MAHFDNAEIVARIQEIDELSLREDFYSKQKEAKKLISERNELNADINESLIIEYYNR